MNIIEKLEQAEIEKLTAEKSIPDFRPGDTIKVMVKVMSMIRGWVGPRPWTAASLGPWPLGSLAQSMHKSVVHAQEIYCVYTRDSFVYTQ